MNTEGLAEKLYNTGAAAAQLASGYRKHRWREASHHSKAGGRAMANFVEQLLKSSSVTPCEKIGGSGGTTPAADSCGKCHCRAATPDLLNQLHTLRSLAHDVKAQADSMRLWTIAVQCAAISETATQAIDHFNAVTTTPSNEPTERVG
jgi:hypothetical protein